MKQQISPYTGGMRTAGARGNIISLKGQHGMLHIVASIGLCGKFVDVYKGKAIPVKGR
jgi:hypothetical protein